MELRNQKVHWFDSLFLCVYPEMLFDLENKSKSKTGSGMLKPFYRH